MIDKAELIGELLWESLRATDSLLEAPERLSWDRLEAKYRQLLYEGSQLILERQGPRKVHDNPMMEFQLRLFTNISRVVDKHLD